MDDIDKLLREIMHLEDKITKIQALNDNKESTVIKQYRRFILVKQNTLNCLNNELCIDSYPI